MTIDPDKLEELARAATLKGHDGTGLEGVVRAAANHGFAVLDHITLADARFLAVARDAVLELAERVRVAEAAVQLGASKLIHDQAFMAKLVDEHEKKYGDGKSVILRAIVRDLAAVRQPIGLGTDEQLRCSLCKGTTDGQWSDVIHTKSCPWRRAVEATKQ